MKDIDISLIEDGRSYDLTIEKGDFVLDETFKTPFLTSLYTNERLIEGGHEYNTSPAEVEIKRGGYWANSLKRISQGSLFWTFFKARKDGATAENAKRTCLQSLSWLNKTIEINYKLKESEIVLNYKVPGEEEDFNFKERF